MAEALEAIFIWSLAAAVGALMLGLIVLIGYVVYREVRGK